jgi:hypothetical protein
MTNEPQPLPTRSPKETGRRRRHVLLGRMLAMVVGILLPLLLLEVSVRLLGPWPPGGYDTGPYIERNELLGHAHVPGYQGWMKAPEFTTFVKISTLGLRDRREAYDKPSGTFRIVLLGDSFLEGVQVNQQDGIAERLEVLLTQQGPVPGFTTIEVINAGVAAYGTGQEVLFFEHEVYRYQPDLVMLLFYVGNDVKNNDLMLEIPGGRRELALKPYFDLDRDGLLRRIPGPPVAPRDPAIGFMRRSCWSYNMMEGSVFSLLGPGFLREDIEVVGGARNPLREIYQTDPERPWRHAWRITEALLGRLKDDARAQGGRFVIVGVPDWRALDDEVWRKTILGNHRPDGSFSPTAPTDRLGDIAARLGTPYLDLLPMFRQETARGGGPFYYAVDGHWNASGHAAAAWALADAFPSLRRATP